MRLFVAAEIDDAARAVAEEAGLAARLATGPALKARWVRPENMHLTIRFIGHVSDERASSILAALTPPLAAAPVDVELAGCGVFPGAGSPRVIWIGLARGLPGLAALHAEFDRRLEPFGFEPERRPFRAHLTLARVTECPRAAARAVRAAVASVRPPPVVVRVSHATIFQSHLSPKGPRYESLARVPLGSAGAA